ncbi:MAG TPA: HAMP domain-containing sensor histidine kinase [Thermoanaerobaculia bacterium]|nr:HAMP domain-containing sensor histidine kinase [Thermoanaerobaculia bacterium]
MAISSTGSRLPGLAVGLLVLLLAGLAALQVHWLRQVVAADRQRLSTAAEAAIAALASEHDREVSRAWLAFQPLPRFGPVTGDELSALWARWAATAPHPDLVSSLLWVPGDGRAVLRLEEGRWQPWGGEPPQLSAPRRDVGSREPGARGPRGRQPSSRRRDRRPPLPSRLRADLPGLEVPLGTAGHGSEPALLVVFDRQYLAATLLPALVRRHLVPVLGEGLAVEVTERGSGSVVYATGATAGGPFDWQVPLFDLLPPEELARLAFAAGYLPRDGGEAGQGVARLARRFAALAAFADTPAAWVLGVRPAAGSLEAAIAHTRRVHAALAFGILLLLALAAVALALTTRRAQQMARRQLEFTAAVSHELRTPLAAIRSLADNLADGLVREPAQARLYGEQIGRQGQRLTEMVEQVLALSAEEAGRRPPERRAVDLAAVVREAVAEAAAAAPGADVETDLPPALPPIQGDAAALRRAVHNLLGNALQHGGHPPWARVRIAAAPSAETVRLEVADRGPGIPAEERGRLFEPFFRGQRAQREQLPGAGLGLALVRRTAAAHGGRVEVVSAPGAGTTFALVLPVRGAPP